MKPIIRPLSTLLLGSTYLLSVFFPFPYASLLISGFALVALISFFPYLQRMPKLLILTLAVGALAMDLSGAGLSHFFTGLQTNVNILAIFIFVPLLAIPIQQGNYLAYIELIFSAYIKKTHQLYLFTMMSTLGIGSVMNIGSIPILYDLTDTDAFKPFNTMKVKAMSRGFVLAFLWSPYFLSVGLILSYFSVSWMQLFPLGFGMAALMILVGYAVQRKTSDPISNKIPIPDRAALQQAKRKVMELIGIVVLITAAIMIIESSTELSVLTIIPLIAIFVSVVWSLIISTPPELIRNFRAFFNVRIPGMGNELSLFIIAGAFGTALLANGADQWILFLLETLKITNVLALIPVIALLMIIPSVIGVHAVISATILSITLSASPIFMNDHLLLSLGLLASWMAAILLSPFSGLNLLLGAISRKSPFEISLKHNLGFTLLLWGICYGGIVVLYFVL